jgi:hypothetical protein
MELGGARATTSTTICIVVGARNILPRDIASMILFGTFRKQSSKDVWEEMSSCYKKFCGFAE